MSPIPRNLIRDRLQQREERRGGGGSYFKPKAGVNVWRLFTFAHVVNAFDVKAMRAQEDMVGDKIDHFFVDVERYWQNRNWINCKPDPDTCPVWQRYWEKWREADEATKKKMRPPRLTYWVNLLDLSAPEKGIQVANLNPSVMEGERDTSGAFKGYGILHHWDGFDPDESRSDTDKELLQEAEGEGESRRKLPTRSGYGDKLFGCRGRDIMVVYKEVQSTFDPNKTQMRLDHNAYESGAIAVRKASKCETLPSHLLEQVQDLWLLEEAFPGVAQSKEKDLWSVAGDFREFVNREKGGEERKARKDGDNEFTDALKDEVDTGGKDDEDSREETPASGSKTKSGPSDIEIDFDDLDTNGEDDEDDPPEDEVDITNLKGDYASEEAAEKACGEDQQVVRWGDGSYSVRAKRGTKKKKSKKKDESEEELGFEEGDKVLVADTEDSKGEQLPEGEWTWYVGRFAGPAQDGQFFCWMDPKEQEDDKRKEAVAAWCEIQKSKRAKGVFQKKCIKAFEE